MVPTNVGGIVVLLLLVVPGIWYELLRQRYRPGRDDSAFIEIGRILMAGVVISGLALTLLALVRLLGPHVVADLGALLTDSGYLGRHLVFTGVTLAFFLALSLSMAPIWLHLTATTGLQSGMQPESAWVTAFSRIPADHARKQGFEWRGHVVLEVHFTGDAPPLRGRMAGYSPQLDLADRELILGPPLESYDAGDRSWQPVERASLIVLRGTEIAQIRTRYVKPAAPVQPAPWATPARRLAGTRRTTARPWRATVKRLNTQLSTIDRRLVAVMVLGLQVGALLLAAGVDRIFFS